MQYTNVYTDEIVPSTDFQAGFAATVGNIAGLLQQLFFTDAVMVITNGFTPAATTPAGGTIVVGTGQAWQDGQSLLLPVTQTMNILSGTENATAGIWGSGLVADTTNPRIDVVVVQYQALATDAQSRAFIDPTTNSQYVQNVNVATVDSFAFEVLHGTASATPVAPSTPAGWIALAQVNVAANATTIAASDIVDLTPAMRISGGALSGVTGGAFYRDDSATNAAPIFTFLDNTTLNLGANTLADNAGALDITTAGGLNLTGALSVSGTFRLGSSATFINAGSYAGSPVLTSLTAGTGITVDNPSAPGAATVSVASAPNTSLTGPLVTAVTAGTGLTASNPAGVGTAVLNLSNAPNSALAGPLVNAITAGTGLVATNPTGVGAASLSVAAIPNSALTGALVSALAAADGLTVSNPTGVGTATVGVSALANSVLTGPLVNALTAGVGTTVTNPTGVGAAEISVAAVPNSALTGPIVEALAAADSSVLVTTPSAVGTASVAVNPAYAMGWTAVQSFLTGLAVASGATLTINGVVGGTAYGGPLGLAILDSTGNVPASELGNVSAVLPPPSPATTSVLGSVLVTMSPTSGDPTTFTTADPRTNRLTNPLSYAWPF